MCSIKNKKNLLKRQRKCFFRCRHAFVRLSDRRSFRRTKKVRKIDKQTENRILLRTKQRLLRNRASNSQQTRGNCSEPESRVVLTFKSKFHTSDKRASLVELFRGARETSRVSWVEASFFCKKTRKTTSVGSQEARHGAVALAIQPCTIFPSALS